MLNFRHRQARGQLPDMCTRYRPAPDPVRI